jgi:hypothetical protein
MSTSNQSTPSFVFVVIRSSGRKVTQLKITAFQEKQFDYFFLIRVFKIEES